MQQHSFNVISFVFGVIFLVAAATHFSTDAFDTWVDSAWIWPLLLGVAGIAIVASAIRGFAADREDDQSS